MAGHALEAVGGNARIVRIPAMALRAAGAIAGAAATLRGESAMLTVPKTRELLHEDWSSTPERQPPAAVWRPGIDLQSGFAETVAWYRQIGWLPDRVRSEEHTSELQSLMRISYAVFCL